MRPRFAKVLRSVPGIASGLLFFAAFASAQSLYKYRGPDGEWVFTDRDPGGGHDIEVRALSRGEPDPRVSLYYEVIDSEIQLFGRNDFHAPVQVDVTIEELRDVRPPSTEQRRFVLPARQDTYLLSFNPLEAAEEPYVAYRTPFPRPTRMP